MENHITEGYNRKNNVTTSKIIMVIYNYHL